MPRQYVIIGSGVAGVAAAEAIRQNDSTGQIWMFGDDPFGYYSRPGLAYYLSGEVPESMLFPFSDHEFQNLGIAWKNARVARIDPDLHHVELQNGQKVPYDRLLLATGSRAAKPPTPGIDLEGVVKLDTLQDARQILGFTRKARSAVVVGGGITALEIAEGLNHTGISQVHYLLRGDRYWSNVLDEQEARLIESRLAADKIRLHFHTEAAEILGKKSKVCGVLTRDGRTIPCELVAYAIGVHPRMDLAAATGIQTERGILVNPYLETNLSDIFAAGDVAQVYDPFSGKAVLDSLWGLAREQGRSAGINMAGGHSQYRKSVAFNVTRLAGLTTTIIGTVGRGKDEDMVAISHGDSETWREMPEATASHSTFEVNRLRLLLGAQTLVGAIVMGDQTLSQTIHEFIGNAVDISPIRQALLQKERPVGETLLEFRKRLKNEPATQPIRRN